MSGWGEAEGKTNVLVFECDSLEQAEIVAENARARGDQKRVMILTRKPYYNRSRYYPQYKTIEDYASWYKKGWFSDA